MSGDFRAVVDANVIIRGVLSSQGASGAIVHALRHHDFQLIISRAYLDEIHGVLRRPRFTLRYGISAHSRHRIIVRLYTLGLLVQPVGSLRICRDPKDDYLIEMALLGRASHLVTEDDDLHDDTDIIALLYQNGIQLAHAVDFLHLLAGP
jgi:hypothetical protein